MQLLGWKERFFFGNRLLAIAEEAYCTRGRAENEIPAGCRAKRPGLHIITSPICHRGKCTPQFLSNSCQIFLSQEMWLGWGRRALSRRYCTTSAILQYPITPPTISIGAGEWLVVPETSFKISLLGSHSRFQANFQQDTSAPEKSRKAQPCLNFLGSVGPLVLKEPIWPHFVVFFQFSEFLWRKLYDNRKNSSWRNWKRSFG